MIDQLAILVSFTYHKPVESGRLSAINIILKVTTLKHEIELHKFSF